MMFKKIISGFAFTLLCPSLFAAPSIDALLSPALEAKLFSENLLTAAHFDDLTPLYAPLDARLFSAIEKIKAETDPGILIESLCYYKKPEGASLWSEENRTKLFNGITAISTLAGLKYYSPSRKKEYTFYETSNIIDSPDNKIKLPDPVWANGELPENFTLYTEQKDLTFGNNIYRFDFTVEEDAIFFYQRNLTTLYYGIFPVLGKKKLCSLVTLLDTDEAILIYMVSMADAVSFPGMKNRVAVSFSSRSRAVLDWFSSKADAVYRQPETNTGLDRGGVKGYPYKIGS
jgi:hypothetical protein